MEIRAYKRSDNTYGIRNKILILPSVGCANETARLIAERVQGAVYVPNPKGCGQVDKSLEITRRTLVGFALNPNIYGTIVVGLGCETVQPTSLYEQIKAMTSKPVELLIIQDEGGTLNTVEKGVRIASSMSQEMAMQQRVPTDLSNLILATNCGGSDATSGITANPVLGYCSDIVVHEGGTVILGETTEFIGAEHILARRAKNDKVRKDLLQIVETLEQEFSRKGIDLRGANPSPGNIKGGLTTLAEKSLGAIVKGGSTSVNQILRYAERPTEKGLVIMDTPGYDIESVSAMVAGGAQICIFTTGRGTPIGNPIIPMIKITGNPKTFANMRDNIDFDASSILSGTKSVAECGEELLNELVQVCNGKLTKAEAYGFADIAIYRPQEPWCSW